MLVLYALQSKNFSTPKVSFLSIRTEKLRATGSCLSLIGHQKYDSLMLSESTIIYYRFTHVMNSANNYFPSETIPSFYLLHKALRPYPQACLLIIHTYSECMNDKISVLPMHCRKKLLQWATISSHKDILSI